MLDIEPPKKPLPKYKPHPLMESLPDHLKDPTNYNKIRKAIFDTVATSCGHSDIISMSKCVKCTENMRNRRLLLKKLGFKSPTQYVAWQKIHEEIRVKYPLVNWQELNRERLLEDLKRQK